MKNTFFSRFEEKKHFYEIFLKSGFKTKKNNSNTIILNQKSKKLSSIYFLQFSIFVIITLRIKILIFAPTILFIVVMGKST